MSELHALRRPRDLTIRGGMGPEAPARGNAAETLPSIPSLGTPWIELPAVAGPARQLESDVHELCIDIPSADSSSALAYRARIELGEGAQASVVVRYVDCAQPSQGAERSDAVFERPAILAHPPLLTTALDIRLAPGARLKLYVLSALKGCYFRETFDSATLGANASLEWIEASFDAIDGIHTASIELEGAESSFSFSGAYAARGRTEQEHILSVRHLAPRTKSRSILKSALKESAHLIFRGLIRVDPKAPGTDAYLSNRNLILEDGARAESLPQLQIDTDDVACSHGATTGGPRPEEIFYLESRGLDREDAKRILVQGHLGSIFAALPEAIAEEFEARALDALSHEPDRSSL